MRIRIRRFKLLAAILLLSVVGVSLIRERLHQPLLPARSVIEHEWRTVTRVVDGDTLMLDGRERVRLVGLDTPESVDPRRPVQRFGREAAEFTRSMTQGKRVRLEFDQQRTDVYGRTLAYVYLEDGTFLNAEIIKQGYGFAYTRFPFRYMDEFKRYEREARAMRRGLWKDKPE